MKKSVLLLVFALSFAAMSCKKEKSEDNLDALKQEEVVMDNSFTVILDVVMKEDDDVALYYTTDGSVDFSKIEPIWQGIKGNSLAQQIAYKLPEGTKPTEFRFDLGLNPKQGDIYLNKVTFKHMGAERVIACPELVDFFRANEDNCTFDPATGLIKSKTVDGKRRFPSIYPHEKKLMLELQKLH